MKLNLGSGYTHIPGFKRLDIDERCRPDILADITDLSKIKSNSIDEIYTAHTLEHIPLTHLFSTLRGICRIMKPGAKITIYLPDVYTVSNDWINNRLPAQYFEKIVLGATPGATEYMWHKQLFWNQKLERYLTITGFYKIETYNLHSSFELKGIAYKPRINGA